MDGWKGIPTPDQVRNLHLRSNVDGKFNEIINIIGNKLLTERTPLRISLPSAMKTVENAKWLRYEIEEQGWSVYVDETDLIISKPIEMPRSFGSAGMY